MPLAKSRYSRPSSSHAREPSARTSAMGCVTATPRGTNRSRLAAQDSIDPAVVIMTCLLPFNFCLQAVFFSALLVRRLHPAISVGLLVFCCDRRLVEPE